MLVLVFWGKYLRSIGKKNRQVRHDCYLRVQKNILRTKTSLENISSIHFGISIEKVTDSWQQNFSRAVKTEVCKSKKLFLKNFFVRERFFFLYSFWFLAYIVGQVYRKCILRDGKNFLRENTIFDKKIKSVLFRKLSKNCPAFGKIFRQGCQSCIQGA